MMIKLKLSKRWLMVGSVLLLTACAGTPSTLYVWDEGQYPQAIYDYVNHEGDPQEQLDNLNKMAQLAREGKVPPGLYAHIGVLQARLGQRDKAIESFNKEMQLFPESQHYMQFLLQGGKLPNKTETKKTGDNKIL